MFSILLLNFLKRVDGLDILNWLSLQYILFVNNFLLFKNQFLFLRNEENTEKKRKFLFDFF